MADNVPSGPMVGGNNYPHGHSFPYNGISTGKPFIRTDHPGYREDPFSNFNSPQSQQQLMRPQMNANVGNNSTIRYGYPGPPALDDNGDFSSGSFNFSKMAHEEMFKQQQRFPRFKMNPSHYPPTSQYMPPMINNPGQNPYPQMSPNNGPPYDLQQQQQQQFQQHMFQQQHQQQQLQQQLQQHKQQTPSRSTTPLSQHSDRSTSNNRPPSSSSLTSKKGTKAKDKKSGKKSASQHEPPPMEEVSMDSNASGSNLSRPATHSRSNTPNLSNLPAPSPAASSGGSRSNTPAVSMGGPGPYNDSTYPPSSSSSSSSSSYSSGQRIFSPSNQSSDVSLMPPPMNPGQGRVFSPPGHNNPQNSFYSPPSTYPAGPNNTSKPGMPMLMNPSDQMNGGLMTSPGYSYPPHPQMMMRSPNPHQPQGYRMRDPTRNFQDFRPYAPLGKAPNPEWFNGRMDNPQEVNMMRQQHMQQQQPGYRPDMNYYNQSRHPMMFNQSSGDYPPYYRSPYDNFNPHQQQPLHMQHSKFHPQQMIQQQQDFQENEQQQNAFHDSSKYENVESDSKQQQPQQQQPQQQPLQQQPEQKLQDEHLKPDKQQPQNEEFNSNNTILKNKNISKDDKQDINSNSNNNSNNMNNIDNDNKNNNSNNMNDNHVNNKVAVTKTKSKKGYDVDEDDDEEANDNEVKDEDDDEKTDEGETTDEDNGDSLNTTENYELNKHEDQETTPTNTTNQQSKLSLYPRLVDQLKATITTLTSTTTTFSTTKSTLASSSSARNDSNTLDHISSMVPTSELGSNDNNAREQMSEEQKLQQQQHLNFQQQQQLRPPTQLQQHLQQQQHHMNPFAATGPQKRFHDGELVRPGIPFYNAYPPHMQQPPTHFGMNYPQQHMFNPYLQHQQQQQMYNQQQHLYAQQKNIDFPMDKKQHVDRRFNNSNLDDRSSSQDGADDNSRMMGDSIITDESSTSDTLLSYPGTSSQQPHMDGSNMDDSIMDHPAKKIKMSKYPPEFEPSMQMPPMPARDQSFHMNMQRLNRNEAFVKLMEMGEEPDRRNFLHDLFIFMESKQSPIIAVPTVSKQPIDLFRLYCIVKKFGGMVEVSKNKKWRDVSSALNMGPSSSAGFVVKKNYGKSIFPFECFHDRGNIDPAPILAYLEQPIKKSSKKSNGDKSAVLDHPNLDPRSEFQNSPRMHENFPPGRPSHQSFPSPSPHPPIYPPGDVFHHHHHNTTTTTTNNNNNMNTTTNNGDSFKRSSHFNDHNSFGGRALKYPPPSYEHLQMVCQPPSPHKLDKRVLGSHIQKELMFPSNCVESIRPRCHRRKKFSQKQIGPVDPWKIMMSLRSGLMCESAWALNVLTGLLADDNAVQWFGLHHMPGLMEALLDHFRAVLISIFEEKFKDLELNWAFLDDDEEEAEDADDKNVLNFIDDINEEFGSTKEFLSSGRDTSKHRVKILDNNNSVTHNPLNGKNVYVSIKGSHKSGATKFQKDLSEERWLRDEKKWDVQGVDEFESSSLDWQLGRGDSSNHIYLSMASSMTKKFSKERFFGDKNQKLLDKVHCDEKKSNDDVSLLVGVENSNVTANRENLLKSIGTSNEPNENCKEAKDTIKCNHKICKEASTKQTFPREDLLNSSVLSSDSMDMHESFSEDNNNFNTSPESLVELERRCLQVSNIFRSLSFVPTNDVEFSKHPGLLIIIARLLLLGHEHNKITNKKPQSSVNSTLGVNQVSIKGLESEPLNLIDKFLLKQFKTSKLACNNNEADDVSMKTIETLREDALVILSNITGQLDLSIYPEEICAPILDGLLHWCTCNSSIAKDCNVSKTVCPTYSTYTDYNDINPSFSMLALECASKLCVLDSNADLLVATPPYSRIVLLLGRLCEAIISGGISDNGVDVDDDPLSWMTNQIAREFSLVIISSLVQADPGCSMMLSLKNNFIPSLLSFIEMQCFKMMQPNLPSTSSTSTNVNDYSPDMLKRAILILKHVVQVTHNNEKDDNDEGDDHKLKQKLLLKYKDKILDLLCNKMPCNTSMTSVLCEVLDICSYT